MELIKKGYESLRLGFLGDFPKSIENNKLIQELVWKLMESRSIESIDKIFGTLDINQYNYNESVWNGENIPLSIRFILDFKKLLSLFTSLLFIEKFKKEIVNIGDRKLINFFYQDEYSKNRIAQFVLFNYNIKVFGIGSIKIDGMFFRIKEATIYHDLLNEIEVFIQNLPANYLKRIDFYFDFNGQINQFLSKSKLRYFKKGSLFNGGAIKNGKLQYKEDATIYRGNKKNKRIIARLYNKRVDTIAKGKLRRYNYINQMTKRFEISIEVKEIGELIKYVGNTNIKNFSRIIYKNTVLKQVVRKFNNKTRTIKRFDIPFIRDDLKFEMICREKIQHINRKRSKELETSMKLKLFSSRYQNIRQSIGHQNFKKFISSIDNNEK